MASAQHIPCVSLERDHHLVTVRLDRESKKNAITLVMWSQLRDLFHELGEEADTHCVIVTGGTGVFSTGADISEFATLRATAALSREYETHVDGCLAALIELPKPTIAAISGLCLGGGMALAAACDFRVADRAAQFGIPAARLGLVYGVPKCKRLVEVVGVTHAKRILLEGTRFDAQAAKACGFVDELVDADAQARARAWAGGLAKAAPLALRGIKAILRAVAEHNTEARLHELVLAIERADASEDHQEAVRAFAEKRDPVFRGR